MITADGEKQAIVALLAADQFDQASVCLQQALDRWPRDAGLLLMQVRLALRQGELQQAHAALVALREQGCPPPDWLPWVAVLAQALDQAGFRPLAQAWLHECQPMARAAGFALPAPLPLPPHIGQASPPLHTGQTLCRYPPYEGDAYIYAIDVAGSCNLRCPSCPVGNMAEVQRSKGLMPLDRFEAILDKIASDRPGLRPIIHLFNWGEPLLHPHLGQIVQAVGRRGWVSYVSTTLNIDRGLDKLVAARPSWIKVSISGDRQQDYGRTHARGQLERVMSNLKLLRRLLDEQPPQQPPIVVTLALHLYRHNQAARESLAALASELGFDFVASPAVLMPIEKNLQLAQGSADALTRQIADDLLMHPAWLSQLNRQRRSGRFDCEARFNMTAINFDGSVALCCCTYSPQLNIHQDFLQSSHEQLEALKYAHPFCETCTRGGFDYSVNDVLPASIQPVA